MASIILQDSNSVLWQFGIVVVGGYPELQSQVVSSGIPQTIILVGSASSHYQLGVDTSGNLIPIPTLAAGVNGYLLGSSDCSTGWIITALPNGNINLTQDRSWNPGPQLGTLFPIDFTAAVYTQPGGPGTIVYPQQSQGEQMGLYVAGCSHWFNSWLVQCVAVCGVPTAVVGCPVCGFVQQLITPFSKIYSPDYMYIIG